MKTMLLMWESTFRVTPAGTDPNLRSGMKAAV